MPSALILGALGYTAVEISAMFAARFAINFAISMIVTRVFSSSAANQNTDNGVRQQVPPATTNSLPIVYGDAYLGGVFVDAVLSTDQKTMYYVLAISQISPNGQFSIDYSTDHATSKMYWQDQTIAFDATDLTKVASLRDGAGNVQTKVAGNLFINLYKSNEAGTITPLNGTALPSVVMGGTDIDAAQRWPSSGRQMNGLAFAIIKMVYSQDAGTTQMQAVTFHASQYLFGSGAAKPGDVWYDYITNTKYGAAMDADIVDGLTATELNTYSDELITYTPSGGGSATQARYRINGVLDTGQNVLSNLDQIMLACDSWNQYNAATGKWSIVINKARSTDFAFDDTNIIGEIRVSAYEIAQSINQIEAQFPNKLNRDQAGFVYINTPSNLLFANEPENKYSLTYSLVNDSVQAQYLSNRLLEQAREDLIVTFSTTYNGIQVDAGDVISVTNAAYGWDAKLFRVIKVSEASLPDGNLGAALELNEYNVQVYDDFDITAYSPAPNSNLPSATYFSPLSIPIVTTSNPSSAIPNFDVTISIPATGRVTFSDLYYTTSPSPSITDWKLLSTASTVNGQVVTPGSSYVFANQVLPTGSSTTITYYFGYTVYNEISSSAISPVSAPFVWTPISGSINTATVYLYNKNTTTTPPALFSGTFTYTFATGVLSGGTLNGWSQTPPSIASGEFLFLSLATAVNTGPTDTIPYTEFSTPEVISGTGAAGANTAIVTIFNKNTSSTTPPTSPSGTFVYTFATAVLSGGTFNGWAQSAPSLTAGEYLWVKQATAYSTNPTDNIAASEFSGAVIGGAFGPTGPAGAPGANGPTGPQGIVGSTGANGLNFINAYKVQSQSAATPTFTTPTSYATIPSGWSATTPSVSVGQVLWYIQGRNNTSSSTIDGVAPNTTAWTGPIAASIFQDIRSDNWNGSTPPTSSNISTWGTTGYYISRTDGNMYANGFYARGVMQVNGSFYDPSIGNTAALLANSSLSSNIGLYAMASASSGIGIIGSAGVGGSIVGVSGASSTYSAVGVLASNYAAGIALLINGDTYSLNSNLATNLNANYVNGMAVPGIASSGSGISTFNTASKPTGTTTTNQWLSIVISGTTYYIPVWQ